MLLIILGSAWVLGTFLGSFFTAPTWLIFTGIIPLAALFTRRKLFKPVILISLCLFAFWGGNIRYTGTVAGSKQNQLLSRINTTVVIKGLVDRAPETGSKTAQVELAVSAIKVSDEWQNSNGKVLLFTAATAEYRYGDDLQIKGKLETPPQLGNFDYRGYLANQGIYATMSFPNIIVLERDRGNAILAWAYRARYIMAQSLARILPEPQASLAQGILLGIRGNIPQSVQDEFSQSGTTHILAISGQNLSIVSGILVSLGIWLFGRRHYIYIWLALAVILVYTMLTGISPPVVRSAIMSGLFLCAELLGRQRSAATALAFAAAVMVGISPPVLWDISFQLSFLSMLGLVIIAPHLQGFSRKAVNKFYGESGMPVLLANVVLDSFGITLAALLMVWPLIAYYFNIVSLVSPLSSLFAVPAMTGIILFSAIAGGFGIVAIPVGQVIGWIAWLFLSYMLQVVRISAAIPHSFISVNSLSPVVLWIYYPILSLVIWSASHRKRILSIISVMKSGIEIASQKLLHLNFKWIVLPLLVVAALVTIAGATLPDNNLHVSFLDVGQGDAVLVRQGNRDILVDGGPSPQGISLELSRRMPFWDRTIELVVSTHPDTDHLTGLVEVLRRYRVEQVLTPEFASDSAIYQDWQALLNGKNIKTTVAREGQRIDLGTGNLLEVLSPAVPPAFESGSDDNSVILRLSAGNASFLLTADLSAVGEFKLIADRAPLHSTVLKVAHHGSAYSTTEEFLDVVNPQVAVISVGKDNLYGHPSPQTVDRLEQYVGATNIYRTDRDGTVEFITDGNRLWVKK